MKRAHELSRSTYQAVLAGALAAAVILAAPEPAAGARAQTSIMLKQSVEIDFTPNEAFFLVEFKSGGLRRVKALLLPPFEAGALPGKAQEETAGRWLAGAQVTAPQRRGKLEYSLILAGKSNRYAFFGPWQEDFSSQDGALDSVDNLREFLLRRKEYLHSLRVQLRAQQESLGRLRADAEVIADLGKILQVREESARVNQEALDLNKDIQTLEKFLKLARHSAAPVNFAGRQNQLTKQLTELSEAAKAAELGEIARRSLSEQELQKRLALVEMTRGEDYDSLQRELVRLRKQRLEMERLPAPNGRSAFESPQDYIR